MPWYLLGASILCLCISTALAVGPQPPKVRPNDTPTFEPAEPGTLDGAAFTKWISTQTSTGSKTLALAEGAYHVTPGSDQAHILLSGLSDVTIWMDSVNLTMSKVGLTAVKIYNCSNLVTYGPTVWWDVPGFSQATITDVQRTSRYAQLHNFPSSRWCKVPRVFHPNLFWKFVLADTSSVRCCGSRDLNIRYPLFALKENLRRKQWRQCNATSHLSDTQLCMAMFGRTRLPDTGLHSIFRENPPEFRNMHCPSKRVV